MSASMLWALSTILPSTFIPPSRTVGDQKTAAFASHLPLVSWRQFFFRILSHFHVGSMFRMTRLHLTRSCSSSTDNSLPDKSFLMLSNHVRFGLPLLFFPGTSIAITLLPTYSSSPLNTCPCHFNLLSWTFLDISPFFAVPMILSFLGDNSCVKYFQSHMTPFFKLHICLKISCTIVQCFLLFVLCMVISSGSFDTVVPMYMIVYIMHNVPLLYAN